MNAIQRFFFNIFLFCFVLGLFFLVKLDSYAFPAFSYTSVNGNPGYEQTYSVVFQQTDSNTRLCFYVQPYTAGSPLYTVRLLTNYGGSFYLTVSAGGSNWPDSVVCNNMDLGQPNGVFIKYPSNSSVAFALFDAVWSFSSNPSLHVFDDLDVAYNYILTGELPETSFDDSLELDYFKVSPYGVWDYLNTTPQDTLSFDYKYDIGWSDSRISKVQLKIDSTRSTQTFESSSSPFKGGFKGSTYAQTDGDVVRLIATPYKSDGSYGVSLYYSFTQKNNSPLVNIWRKLFKNNHTDNTITIPYNNTTVTQPVDGVGTVNNYKVNYNPVTNEYGDLNLYEIYYQPVVIYETDTPQEEIDDTQEVVNNTYVTNNYYETTKNINLGFDINFGDISNNDITQTFDDFGNFGNGFGSFINRLASWLQLLFPFLHPAVAASIVFVFGLIVSLAIIALVLKIAGVIADIIPF